MKNIKYILLIITLALFASCEDVVDVDLDTAPPRLVVDASINWVKGTDGSHQTIKLTTTTNYYNTVIPVATDATVFITNTTGTVYNFIEEPGTGNYNCTNFVPVIGESYTLNVEFDGQNYTATETLFPVPDITYTAQDNEGGFLGESVEVRFYYQDDALADNFYMIRFDSDVMPYPDYDVLDDEFFQGNEMFGIFSDEDLVPGQVLGIKLFGVSEGYYNYMNILIELAEGGGGGPFQTVPTTARGNIINRNNDSNYALGYFRLGEVDTLDYTIQ